MSRWIKVVRTDPIPKGPMWVTDGYIVELWANLKSCPIRITSVTHYIIFVGDIPKPPKNKKDRDEVSSSSPLPNKHTDIQCLFPLRFLRQCRAFLGRLSYRGR